MSTSAVLLVCLTIVVFRRQWRDKLAVPLVQLVMCFNTKISHFSHPFLGTYEVHQFLNLGYLEGTHSEVVNELHTNTTVPWNVKPIPYPTHTKTMLHTIPYHTIPYHTIWPHTIPSGVSGVLLPNMKSISTGCNTCLLGFIFCGQVLQIFAVILSYKWRL